MKRIEKFGIVFCMIIGVGLSFWTEQKAISHLCNRQYEEAFIKNEKNEQQVMLVEEENKREQKVAYLTFDDGPSVYTPQVLDILNKYGIHATFFLIGENVDDKMLPIIERTVKEGNLVGIHTYSHRAEKIYGSCEAFQKDVQMAKAVIENAIHEKVRFYRFPWGSANGYLRPISKHVIPWLQEQGITYCDWNVSGEDSIGKCSEWSIYHNVEKDMGRFKQSFILLHDSKSCCLTVSALPQIIEDALAKGYRFDTIDHAPNVYQCCLE
ncbi:MAG: polysaccharide deacetylase [Lachnospiraceae bacterium]|nr:polysaccharide deacetylase [Lachnospiraceae bacterium]MCR4801878.1 polysaccharide deacetylase [Lachnospiraceae bacterium]